MMAELKNWWFRLKNLFRTIIAIGDELAFIFEYFYNLFMTDVFNDRTVNIRYKLVSYFTHVSGPSS